MYTHVPTLTHKYYSVHNTLSCAHTLPHIHYHVVPHIDTVIHIYSYKHTMLSHTLTHIRTLTKRKKKDKITSASKDRMKGELLCTFGKNVSQCSHHGKY